MNISIISVFPELYDNFARCGIIGKALEKKLVSFNFVRFSDLCQPKERIDEPTCGPGAGMILKPELIEKAIASCEEKWGPGFKIFFSPQGLKITQPVLQKIAKFVTLNSPASRSYLSVGWFEGQDDTKKNQDIPHIILVCARYEGIDARVEEHYADLVISIGDYVLMGGDLPAQVFLEAFLRLIPGIIGKQASVEHDSFSGPLLDYPEYGLPVEWKGQVVPPVLLSGNHAQIATWRTEQASKKTIYKRFDWFASHNPDQQIVSLARHFIPNHYAVLMHTDVIIKGGRVGESSIASVDIHDIARSCKTYGLKNFFVVTPLEDQQAILKTFLDFWQSEAGKKYNKTRHEAVSSVYAARSFMEVVNRIQEQEKEQLLLIATSAREQGMVPELDYRSQSFLWEKQRPMLFIFGTGQGLSDQLVSQCDYMLWPITGLTEYNHLSVRSAAAIIFDRWLGLNPSKNDFFLEKGKK